MIPLTLNQLAGLLSAQHLGADGLIEAVSTDSRQMVTKPGTLFIALKGERWDGAQFAAQAVSQGAQALLLPRRLPLPVPQIIVSDIDQALRQLACWCRQHAKARWLAVTGSNGKSSVKEMVAAILKQKGDTLATWQNQNNHQFGVPLTLLQVTPVHQFAVIEVAANAPGEIAASSALVQPEVALVNNIAAAHLAGFGLLTGVAQAKGEIFSALAADGLAIINSDSHDLVRWQQRLTASQKVCRFALAQQPGVNFYASAIEAQPEGSYRFTLHTPNGTTLVNLPGIGEHRITNAVAAAALTMAVGADLTMIQQGLAQCYPLPGRLARQRLAPGKWLVDDSYNANVASMQAAIQVLHQQPGYRLLVVGDMAELGDQSVACHQQVADTLQCAAVDQVFSFGLMSALISRAVGGQHFTDFEDLLAAVTAQWQQQPVITLLVKGSRRAKLDRLVSALQERVAC
ncbi:MAG: UDP-N-acetylmuramoyl-tripeptide--D-alanyl-D-alanine ligase [Candidatus Symbiodolus clandestinus]